MHYLTVASVTATIWVAIVTASTAPSCSQNGTALTYFSDEDCSKYWECTGGVALQEVCPENLVFNPKTNICDWPQVAGCTGLGWNPNPPSGCTTTTTTSSIVTSITSCQGQGQCSTSTSTTTSSSSTTNC